MNHESSQAETLGRTRGHGNYGRGKPGGRGGELLKKKCHRSIMNTYGQIFSLSRKNFPTRQIPFHIPKHYMYMN